MSTTTGPYNIAGGVPFPLGQPVSGILEALVLTNLSAFLLAVNVGGNNYWQNPWSETIYDLTNSTSAPININPSQPSGDFPTGASEQIMATWYFAGEKPEGVWPISLAANAIAANIGQITGNTAVVNGLPSPLLTGPTLAAAPILGDSNATSGTLPTASPVNATVINAPSANLHPVLIAAGLGSFQLSPGDTVTVPVKNPGVIGWTLTTGDVICWCIT